MIMQQRKFFFFEFDKSLSSQWNVVPLSIYMQYIVVNRIYQNLKGKSGEAMQIYTSCILPSHKLTTFSVSFYLYLKVLFILYGEHNTIFTALPQAFDMCPFPEMNCQYHEKWKK